jgi:hypothetical protein
VLLALLEEERYGFDTLIGGQASRVHQDLSFRHTPLDQVVTPHTSLGISWVASTAPSGDDQGREAVLLKVKGVIEAGFEDRRRRAIILRGAKDDEGIRRPCLLSRGLMADGQI